MGGSVAALTVVVLPDGDGHVGGLLVVVGHQHAAHRRRRHHHHRRKMGHLCDATHAAGERAASLHQGSPGGVDERHAVDVADAVGRRVARRVGQELAVLDLGELWQRAVLHRGGSVGGAARQSGVWWPRPKRPVRAARRRATPRSSSSHVDLVLAHHGDGDVGPEAGDPVLRAVPGRPAAPDPDRVVGDDGDVGLAHAQRCVPGSRWRSERVGGGDVARSASPCPGGLIPLPPAPVQLASLGG